MCFFLFLFSSSTVTSSFVHPLTDNWIHRQESEGERKIDGKMEYKGGVFKGRLNDDGLITELYNYLWTVNSEDASFMHRSLTISDTVVYERGFPKVWYSWEAAQSAHHFHSSEESEEEEEKKAEEERRRQPASALQLKKHLGKDIVLTAIRKKFTRQAKHPVVAQYVTFEPSASSERFADIMVEYLSASDLDAFFKKRAPGAIGVLQEFVSPKWDENVVFEVVWTVSQVNINSRKNKNRLSTGTIPLRERCTTFDGNHGVSSFCNVPEQTHHQIAQACTVLMNKMQSTESVPMTGLVAFIKTDENGRPHLLYCTSMRSRLLEGIGKRDPLRVSVSYKLDDTEVRRRNEASSFLPSSFAPPNGAVLSGKILDRLERRIEVLNRAPLTNATPDEVALAPTSRRAEVAMVGEGKYKRLAPHVPSRPSSTSTNRVGESDELRETNADMERRLKEISQSRADDDAMATTSSIFAVQSMEGPRVEWREFPTDKLAPVRQALYDALADALYTSVFLGPTSAPVKATSPAAQRSAGTPSSARRTNSSQMLLVHKFFLPVTVQKEMTAERYDALGAAAMLGHADVALDPESGEYVDLLHFRPGARTLTDQLLCEAVMKTFPPLPKRPSSNGQPLTGGAQGSSHLGGGGGVRALSPFEVPRSPSLNTSQNTSPTAQGGGTKTASRGAEIGSSGSLMSHGIGQTARQEKTRTEGNNDAYPTGGPQKSNKKTKTTGYTPRWRLGSSFPAPPTQQRPLTARVVIAASDREQKSTLSPSRRRVYYAAGPRGPLAESARSQFGVSMRNSGPTSEAKSTGDLMLDFWTQ